MSCWGIIYDADVIHFVWTTHVFDVQADKDSANCA